MHIDSRSLLGADFLADIEHRRFIALALADHHRPGDGQAVQFLAHGIDSSLIGSHFIAAPTQPCRRHGCTLGHTDELQCENAIQPVGVLLCGLGHLNKVLNLNCVYAASPPSPPHGDIVQTFVKVPDSPQECRS